MSKTDKFHLLTTLYYVSNYYLSIQNLKKGAKTIMENHFKENLDYLTHEEKFNCNVAELAKKLNVTRQSIRYYTIGKAKPSFDNLIKICEIYDITPTQLITWDLQESFKNL